MWFYLLVWLIFVGLWLFTTPLPYLACGIYHLVRWALLLVSWPIRALLRR
jgi:hypothetical protein